MVNTHGSRCAPDASDTAAAAICSSKLNVALLTTYTTWLNSTAVCNER